VAYYPFEGNADDVSGNGNHGVENGGPLYVGGVCGEGISLDGVDDYIDLQRPLIPSAADFSFNAWIRPEIIQSLITIVSQYDGFSAGRFTLQCHENNRRLYCFTYWNGADRVIRSNTSIELDIWQMVTVTRNGDTLSVYLDGDKGDSLEIPGLQVLTEVNTALGQAPYHGGWPFDGIMDEVRLYDRALSASEIHRLALACAPEPVAFHVDGTTGDDADDGLTRETAFETIQKGIDTAEDGNIVLVWPGVYVGQLFFDGKAITLKSADYPAVIEAPWQDAVSFIAGEGSGSVLSNFVIRESATALACNNESSPTLKNLTIVDNDFGIAAYENSDPDIANCILWNNQYGDLYGCEARYSCVETDSAGDGNISVDPMLADLDGGDYHPLSENGRYVPAYGLWSFDDETSPCVDAGDPAEDPSAERMPNGGRINMGAYGGTAYASKGEWPKHMTATMTGGWISKKR